MPCGIGIQMNKQSALLVIVTLASLLLPAASPAADASPSPSVTPIAAASKGAGEALPSGEEVMRRLLSRSTNLSAATNHPVWTYDKTQVTLKLDDDGKVAEREEKFYRVEIVKGVPFSRLVKIGGHDLTPAEIEKENQREAAFQKGLSGRDPKKSVSEREALITTNIADLFQYQVLRREPVHGHPALVVSFDAKPGKGDKSMQDRLLRAIAGTVWVDEDTADVARLEVRLTKAVSFGVLGMLGSIKEVHMDMESTPMPDGTWLPDKTEMSFAARIFLSGIRVKMEETSTNFVAKPASEISVP